MIVRYELEYVMIVRCEIEQDDVWKKFRIPHSLNPYRSIFFRNLMMNDFLNYLEIILHLLVRN